jgi:hypothetical protein
VYVRARNESGQKVVKYQRNLRTMTAGETLAAIAKSYGVDISMISRLR